MLFIKSITHDETTLYIHQQPLCIVCDELWHKNFFPDLSCCSFYTKLPYNVATWFYVHFTDVAAPHEFQSCQCCICPELWKCIEQRRSTIAHTGGSVFNLAGADLNHNKLLERQLTVKNSRKRRPTAPLDLACGAASANHANHRNSDVIYGSFCRRCLVSRFFLSRFSISRLLLFCIRFESITSICFLVAIFCSINWTMN